MQKKRYKVPHIPKVSLILMLIYLVGGSILISLKNVPIIPSLGMDLPGFIVVYLFFFLFVGGSFYYAFFESTDEDKK